jgi:hypothetical protein
MNRMAETQLPLGRLALAAMHEEDEERGVDPHTPSVTVALGPAPTPPPTIHELLQREPVDWRAEERARLAAERREETERTQVALEPLAEAERTAPAKANPRRWRAEQMRPGS